MNNIAVNGSRMIVDYSIPVKKLIEMGNYDHVEPKIFQVLFKVSHRNGKFELPINVVHPLEISSTESLMLTIKNKGLRHGATEEILTLGFSFPDLQQKFPIYALNAWCTLGEDKYVLCLSTIGEKRSLSLHQLEENWFPFCRFLVFNLDHNQKGLPQTIIHK